MPNCDHFRKLKSVDNLLYIYLTGVCFMDDSKKKKKESVLDVINREFEMEQKKRDDIFFKKLFSDFKNQHDDFKKEA